MLDGRGRGLWVIRVHDTGVVGACKRRSDDGSDGDGMKI